MKHRRVPTKVTGVRRIDRSVAKELMKKAGFKNINKNVGTYWRNFI